MDERTRKNEGGWVSQRSLGQAKPIGDPTTDEHHAHAALSCCGRIVFSDVQSPSSAKYYSARRIDGTTGQPIENEPPAQFLVTKLG